MELEVFDDLEAAAADAAGALDRAARHSPFERLDWYRLVARHTPPGDPLVVRAKDGKSRAWLFLARIGHEAEAWGNWYQLRTGPVLDVPNGNPAPLPALAEGLRAAGVSRLFLRPLAPRDPLPAALRKRGWATSTGRINCSWRTRTAGLSFDDYWAKRPSRLRNTAKRKAKTAGLRCELHTEFSDAAWDAYEAVFAKSWKPEEGSAAFIRDWARHESAAGTLRLGLAWLDDKPVAAQFWVVENGTAIIHKLAYSEEAKHCSPGTVLSVDMFRHAIDVDRVELIDFGLGNDPYKREWMDECEPLYALTAYDLLRPRGLAGAVRAGVSKLVRRAASR